MVICYLVCLAIQGFKLFIKKKKKTIQGIKLNVVVDFNFVTIVIMVQPEFALDRFSNLQLNIDDCNGYMNVMMVVGLWHPFKSLK